MRRKKIQRAHIPFLLYKMSQIKVGRTRFTIYNTIHQGDGLTKLKLEKRLIADKHQAFDLSPTKKMEHNFLNFLKKTSFVV